MQGIYTILNYLTDGEEQPISIIRMEEGIKGKVENYYYLRLFRKDTDSINRGGMIQPVGCHF